MGAPGLIYIVPSLLSSASCGIVVVRNWVVRRPDVLETWLFPEVRSHPEDVRLATPLPGLRILDLFNMEL